MAGAELPGQHVGGTGQPHQALFRTVRLQVERKAGSPPRCSSPPAGRSILSTAAPAPASIRRASGPGSRVLTSMTLLPASRLPMPAYRAARKRWILAALRDEPLTNPVAIRRCSFRIVAVRTGRQATSGRVSLGA